MKKYLWLLAFPVIFSHSSFAQASEASQTDSSDYRAILSDLPDFIFEDISGQQYTEKNFKNGKSTILVLFNPTCEHCENLAADISKKIDQLKDVNVVMVAARDMLPYMKKFLEDSGLDKNKQVKVGADRSDLINKVFEYKALPQVNVYNKENKLVWKKNGDSSVKEMLLYTK